MTLSFHSDTLHTVASDTYDDFTYLDNCMISLIQSTLFLIKWSFNGIITHLKKTVPYFPYIYEFSGYHALSYLNYS